LNLEKPNEKWLLESRELAAEMFGARQWLSFFKSARKLVRSWAEPEAAVVLLS
jgi:hypothetical protein